MSKRCLVRAGLDTFNTRGVNARSHGMQERISTRSYKCHATSQHRGSRHASHYRVWPLHARACFCGMERHSLLPRTHRPGHISTTAPLRCQFCFTCSLTPRMQASWRLLILARFSHCHPTITHLRGAVPARLWHNPATLNRCKMINTSLHRYIAAAAEDVHAGHMCVPRKCVSTPGPFPV